MSVFGILMGEKGLARNCAGKGGGGTGREVCAGRPQCGQAGAAVEISLPQSGQVRSGIDLTRHKISDRARARAWLQAGRTNYTKGTHWSGARFAASPGRTLCFHLLYGNGFFGTAILDLCFFRRRVCLQAS
jgi:hypothetical protein